VEAAFADEVFLNLKNPRIGVPRRKTCCYDGWNAPSDVHVFWAQKSMKQMLHRILNKIANSDDEKEALSHLSFDCPKKTG
jgi:hypothetical protein